MAGPSVSSARPAAARSSASASRNSGSPRPSIAGIAHRSRGSSIGTLAAIALAYWHFGRTFRGDRSRFWQRMTETGVTLGALALAAGEGERVRPKWWRDIPLGVAIAGGLFAIFQVGDRFARRTMPRGDDEIREIYGLRELAPKEEIALRLATVIGPAEELFWRGWLQRRIGWIGSTLAYGGAHLVTGNTTLIGAASVAGLYWGALAAIGAPMTALIVSHSLWDIWIFLVQPTERYDKEDELEAAERGTL